MSNRKLMVGLSVFLLGFLILAPVAKNLEKPRRCPGVALVVLLGDKPGLNNKCITTTGVIRVGKEWSNLYLNYESEKQTIRLNSLGLGFTKKQEKILEQYNGEYISVTGIYDNASNSLSDVEFFTF